MAKKIENDKKILNYLKKRKGLKENLSITKEVLSIIKDVCLIIVPVLIVFINTRHSTRELENRLAAEENHLKLQQQFDFERIKAENRMEMAKLIDQYSGLIFKGGNEAKLAVIALDTDILSKEQYKKLIDLVEGSSGSADKSGEKWIEKTDEQFNKTLDELFAEKESTRSIAYGRMLYLLLNSPKPEYIERIFKKIEDDPLNIFGRSNCLSLLSEVGDTEEGRLFLISYNKENEGKNKLELQLKRIEDLRAKGVVYAVGPQTMGWINDIRKKIKESS